MYLLLIKCIFHILSLIETNWSIFSYICSKVLPHLVQRYVYLRFFELPSYDDPSLEAVLSKNNSFGLEQKKNSKWNFKSN